MAVNSTQPCMCANHYQQHMSPGYQAGTRHRQSWRLEEMYFCWYFSAPLALFLYRKCMGKQCPFGKWHQNSALKDTILRTTKRCPKDTILVPLIFLSGDKISVHVILLVISTAPFNEYNDCSLTLWEIWNERGCRQLPEWESKQFAPDLKSKFHYSW